MSNAEETKKTNTGKQHEALASATLNNEPPKTRCRKSAPDLIRLFLSNLHSAGQRQSMLLATMKKLTLPILFVLAVFALTALSPHQRLHFRLSPVPVELESNSEALEPFYDCAAFLRGFASSFSGQNAQSQLTREPQAWHAVVASELRQCRHVLQVGQPEAGLLSMWGSKVESVTVVSPSVQPACGYRPVGDRPNVLYRQVPQLLEAFAEDRAFDCVVFPGLDCFNISSQKTTMRYVTAADVVVLEANHTHAGGIECARAVAAGATASGMQVKMATEFAPTSLHQHKNGQHHLWVLRKPSFRTCKPQGVVYKPSALEQEWMRLSTTPFLNNEDYCRKALEYAEPFALWLGAAAAPEVGRGPAMDMAFAESGNLSGVLSQHIYTFKCGDKTTTYNSYLEPLAGSLRHPAGWCRSWTDIVRYDWLLPASDLEPPNKRTRTFLFDAGARTYAVGAGRNSNGRPLPAQKYFVETYHKLGIRFDRMLLWEPNVTQGDIFQVVPRHLLPQYQYFSFGGSTSDNNTNPLVVIKQLCVPSDFVVLKMDIDRPEVEQAWLDQLVNDVELHQLVDEFYYEFNPLEAGWGGLTSVYKALAALRHAGIRAHGWI